MDLNVLTLKTNNKIRKFYLVVILFHIIVTYVFLENEEGMWYFVFPLNFFATYYN